MCACTQSRTEELADICGANVMSSEAANDRRFTANLI
jgi:hypothetical protein